MVPSVLHISYSEHRQHKRLEDIMLVQLLLTTSLQCYDVLTPL